MILFSTSVTDFLYLSSSSVSYAVDKPLSLSWLLSHHPVSPSTHLSTPILSHCHFPSFCVLSFCPPSPSTHIRLPNNFPVILLIHSADPSLSPSLFLSLYPLSLPAGLVSLAMVLGGDSSLESLIKHLQASALDHTHMYSVSTLHR